MKGLRSNHKVVERKQRHTRLVSLAAGGAEELFLSRLPGPVPGRLPAALARGSVHVAALRPVSRQRPLRAVRRAARRAARALFTCSRHGNSTDKFTTRNPPINFL